MKKLFLFSAFICLTMMASAAPIRHQFNHNLSKQEMSCTQDSAYYYENGVLNTKDYFTYNDKGILVSVYELVLEDSVWSEYVNDLKYDDKGNLTNETWKLPLVDGGWLEYYKYEYFYNEAGAQTGSAEYALQDGVWVGQSNKNIVVNGDTTSYVQYRWSEGAWVVQAKTDTIREGNTETIVQYMPGPQGLTARGKTVNELKGDGSYVSTDYTFNGENWAESSKKEYDKKEQPTVMINSRNMGGEWVYMNKEENEYNDAKQLAKKTTFSWDSSKNDWNVMRVETYIYDANGNNTEYTSAGYMGTDIAYGNKTVCTYNDNNLLTSSIMYGFDATEKTFTVNQSKNEYDYNDNNEVILSATYNWDTEKNDWVCKLKQEYEFDANGNLINETYFELYWDGTEYNWKGEYYYSCQETSIEEIQTILQEGTYKVIVDGQMYIVRDGVMYNVQGALMK